MKSHLSASISCLQMKQKAQPVICQGRQLLHSPRWDNDNQKNHWKGQKHPHSIKLMPLQARHQYTKINRLIQKSLFCRKAEGMARWYFLRHESDLARIIPIPTQERSQVCAQLQSFTEGKEELKPALEGHIIFGSQDKTDNTWTHHSP